MAALAITVIQQSGTMLRTGTSYENSDYGSSVTSIEPAVNEGGNTGGGGSGGGSGNRRVKIGGVFVSV